eukprot:m.451605 g.451605  ORF g.451605 m.451605 type:complete len:236 (-) comp20324_c2_seq43:982-1689(-)
MFWRALCCAHAAGIECVVRGCRCAVCLWVWVSRNPMFACVCVMAHYSMCVSVCVVFYRVLSGVALPSAAQCGVCVQCISWCIVPASCNCVLYAVGVGVGVWVCGCLGVCGVYVAVRALCVSSCTNRTLKLLCRFSLNQYSFLPRCLGTYLARVIYRTGENETVGRLSQGRSTIHRSDWRALTSTATTLTCPVTNLHGNTESSVEMIKRTLVLSEGQVGGAQNPFCAAGSGLVTQS